MILGALTENAINQQKMQWASWKILLITNEGSINLLKPTIKRRLSKNMQTTPSMFIPSLSTPFFICAFDYSQRLSTATITLRTRW